jgi:tetratricopeptide (TPR) repeat protein
MTRKNISKNAKKSQSSFSYRTLLIIFFAGLLIFTGIWANKLIFSWRTSVNRVPEIDLSSMEVQVADKIRVLLGEVEKNPKSAETWGRLAMNLDVHDLKQESISCYEQAAQLDSNDFRWPYYCSIVLRDMGSPQALTWFERSRKLKPDYTPLSILYGRVLLDSGRLEEASELFNLAADADLNSSQAYLGLAQIALFKGNLQASQSYLLRALKSNPRHGEVYGLLAEVYRRLKRPQEAREALRRAQQLPKVTPLSDPVYAKLMAEGVSSFWYRKRGRAYLELGKYDKAVPQFRKALEAKPDAEAHDNLGLSLQYLGKYDEAAQHHRQAVTLNPNFISALNNLATVLFELGKVDEAVNYMERVIELNPNLSEAYLNLGTFYMRAGNTKKAIDLFRLGLTRAPDELRIPMRLSWLLSTSSQKEMRNGPEAVRLAEKVCEKTNYRIPETLDVLAAAYAETGQFSKAVQTAHVAHNLAVSANKTDLANQINSRLKYYKAKQPYREKLSEIKTQ